MHAVVVKDWAEGPKYTEVEDAPAPTSTQLRLRVLAAGLHQVVRSRAAGQHYSARTLPHTLGIDCVGVDEASPERQQYYVVGMRPDFGTFCEHITVEQANAIPLPAGVEDPAQFAASVNPAMSSWMALTQRTFDLPENYTVLILGATTASGRLAVHAARELGAGKVIGVARNAATLANVAGLDARLVLADKVTETDFSAVGEHCDVVLDYLYGEPAAHLLASIKPTRAVQYVQIGSMAGTHASLPGTLFRSYDLTVRGSGPGAFTLQSLGREMRRLVPRMAGWPLLDTVKVPMRDVQAALGDESLAAKGRIVVVP
ncbi:NAD(P)-binding protein [Xylariomycetidae sp. FL0641]|nr:NAD(P)-binding protein [Xylariomycetidae sp. FL0641]